MPLASKSSELDDAERRACTDPALSVVTSDVHGGRNGSDAGRIAQVLAVVVEVILRRRFRHAVLVELGRIAVARSIRRSLESDVQIARRRRRRAMVAALAVGALGAVATGGSSRRHTAPTP